MLKVKLNLSLLNNAFPGHQISRIFLFILGGLICASASAEINNFTAQYEVFHNNIYVAKSKRKVSAPAKNTLMYEATTEPAGLASWFFDIVIKEKSLLTKNGKQLQFKQYEYTEIKDGKINPGESYTLKKMDKQSLHNSFLGETLPLEDNLQDGLGFLLAIMNQLQNGHKVLEFTIAEKDKLKPYTLKFAGEEPLETYDGIVNTMKFEHYSHKTGYRFTFWVAKSLGYFPVRIHNVKSNGNEILISLTHLNKKSYYFELVDDSE